MYNIDNCDGGGGGGGGGISLTSKKKFKRNNRATFKKLKHMKQLEKFKEKLQHFGWRYNFINNNVPYYIGEELDNIRENELIKEYTKSLLVKAINTHSDKSNYEILYATGLSKKYINKLIYVIHPLYNTCYTHNQLLDIAIEYALGIYEKILKNDQKYLVNTVNLDTWVPDTTFKYLCNISKHLNTKLCENALLNFPDINNENSRLFFHATNIRSALSIVKQGISHIDGRKCLDFGINPSFYMTPDIKIAINWSNKKQRLWEGETCILIFRIPHIYMDAMKGKVFENATSEWEELVTSSRRCIVKMNDLDLFDTVYGPMASNIHAIDKNNKFARPHNILKFQLASKSVMSDMYFNKCYAGIIFI